VKKPLRIRTVSATEAKNRLGEILKYAYANEEHVIIERGGIPVAAIVPMQDYAQLIEEKDLPEAVKPAIANGVQAAASRTRLRAFLAAAHRQMPDVPEEESNQDIQTAISAIRS